MTDYPLYMKNSNYYVIINKGDYNNIGVEFKTFNQKFINNDDLRSYLLMDFNEENLKEVLKELFKGSNNFENMNFDNFDLCRNIIFSNNIYKLNNWLDVLNFSAGRI